MLSDAVESATRTLAEPTPSRIDALVRDLTALVREYPALLPQEVRQRLVLPVRK